MAFSLPATSRRHGRRHLMTEINMIPLIDVALVLVIIFMVITPFLLRSQIQVNIPKSLAASQAPETPLEITVTKSGHVFIGAREIKWPDLERELAVASKGKMLLIQADKNIALDKIVRIMDVARRLKISKLGIAATPTGS
ncbi:MAG: biopolymer transporter ExbD [Elusimicrobia bacterium]|nr:biopolymer transporter ExbD [Elusimicrobiota bacterium]